MLEYKEKISKEMAERSAHSRSPCSALDLHLLAKKRSRTQRPWREVNAPILIHVAEMKKEWTTAAAERHDPVQYLDKIGILGPDVVRAHCIYVDEDRPQDSAQRKSGVCTIRPAT